MKSNYNFGLLSVWQRAHFYLLLERESIHFGQKFATHKIQEDAGDQYQTYVCPSTFIFTLHSSDL